LFLAPVKHTKKSTLESRFFTNIHWLARQVGAAGAEAPEQSSILMRVKCGYRGEQGAGKPYRATALIFDHRQPLSATANPRLAPRPRHCCWIILSICRLSAPIG
jgi:hypothetical protein